MAAKTFWGSEFEDVVPSGDDAEGCLPGAAAHIRSGEWASALTSLARVYEAQPEGCLPVLELASALRLLSQGDARGGVARLHFALGRDIPSAVLDAALEQLAAKLLEAEDAPWAALAWTLHSQGLEKIRPLVDDELVLPSWISDDGHEALEDLVYERADQTNDPGWRALSARLASQETRGEIDESTIVTHARPSDRHNPRAWGLYIQVLLGLDRIADATDAEGEALELFRERPRQLLELLDAADADDALPRIVEELEQRQPHWLADRPSVAAVERRPATHSAREALATGLDLAFNRPRLPDTTGLVLPEPPRRTDDEWLERKRLGDAAMTRWLRTRVSIAVFVLVVAWVLYRTLSAQ